MADRPPGDATSEGSADPDDHTSDAADEQVSRFWRELPILLVAALVIAILIKTFLVQAFYIPSISMSPTLEKGDRILVCRVCVHIGGIDRGDVIVFSDPQPKPGPDRGPIGGGGLTSLPVGRLCLSRCLGPGGGSRLMLSSVARPTSVST